MSGGNAIAKSSVDVQENQQLWNKMKVFFRLDSRAFSGNRIIGSVTFVPPEADSLLEKFVLITNNSIRTEFERKFRRISAIGFDPTEKQSVQIEAIPNQPYLEPKSSDEQNFHLSNRSSHLMPTAQFHWPDLIVRWYHIGDQFAQVYIICLDGKEIYYIREAFKHDLFKVRIREFKSGSTHRVRILARLNSGEETYQSEEMEVTVPPKGSEPFNVIINVREEADQPDDMQDLIKAYLNDQVPKIPARIEPPPVPKPDPPRPPAPPKPVQPTFSCGCHVPHTSFPGFDHYFNLGESQQLEDNSSRQDDDDDDDVVNDN